MKITTMLAVGLLSGSIAATASAQISISGTSSGTYDSSGLSPSISYSLQSSANTLVFGTYIDSGYTASSVQFAGAGANAVVQDQRATLAYFFNPAASGNITFTLSAGNVNSAYFIYELSGVNTAAAVNTGTGASITTTSPNRFIVDFIGANNTDGSGPLTPNTAGGSILTLSGISNANGGAGGGTIGAGYAANVGSTGVQTLGWTGFGGGFAQGEVSAAFAAVPEPGSLGMLLGGLGILVLGRRRNA